MVLLLTGVTGFLGQAVYREWVTQRPNDRIVVLVRANKKHTSDEHFSSLQLPHSERAIVVEADFTHERLGLDEAKTNTITHVVHCIGLTRFDASPEEALKVNVDITRNVALFATKCPNLQRFVHVSTAYVHPHDSQINLNALVGSSIEAPTEDKAKKAYRATRAHHFNAYTWSKSISEHVVTNIIDPKNASGSRLSIVRPSIIGPAWSKPEPGWCVAKASPPVVAGMMIGTGFIKVGRLNSLSLNIVPVDVVATRVVDAALGPPCAFHHVVVPPTKETVLRECFQFMHDHYGEVPSCQYRGTSLRYADLWSHTADACASWWFEDAHAYFWSVFNPSFGSLMRTAINVKNVMFRTYGESKWHFGDVEDDLHDVDDVEYRQRSIVSFITRGRAEVMSKTKRHSALQPERIGHYVEHVLMIALFVVLVMAKNALYQVMDYCKNSFAPYVSMSSFELTLTGGTMGSFLLDSNMVILLLLGQGLLYVGVLAAAYETKKRNWVSADFVKRWRYRHNVALSLFSWFIAIAFWAMSFAEVGGLTMDLHKLTCANPHDTYPAAFDMLQFAWILSKAWEWIDTVFLIWTDHTPIPLHLWHHATTMLLFALLTIYPFIAKLGPMWNGLIHGIMYAHYAQPFPRWVRPYMTSAQLVQFGLGAYMGWYGFSCDYTQRPAEVLTWGICEFICGSYIVLFADFFRKSYLQGSKKGKGSKKAKAPKQSIANVSDTQAQTPKQSIVVS